MRHGRRVGVRFGGMPQNVGLTVAESTPRQPPVARPPAGAPNVVAIVLDDTGFAQLGCFGSDIATPTHRPAGRRRACATTASTSPRCARPPGPAFFTGRNHHAVGMGFLADIPMAFPGYTARIPTTRRHRCPRLLAGAGYNTMAVGKWHLTPRWRALGGRPVRPVAARPRASSATTASCRATPTTGRPTWCRDNHYLDPPRRPEDGYHLTEDLADVAMRYVLDQQQAAPGKPFFLYFALGAMHAPHHVAPQWVEPYRGAFDDGLGRLAGRAFAGAGRRRGGPDRHGAHRAPALGAGVGRAHQPTSGACTPASRRCSPASSPTPTPRSAGSSTS